MNRYLFYVFGAKYPQSVSKYETYSDLKIELVPVCFWLNYFLIPRNIVCITMWDNNILFYWTPYLLFFQKGEFVF